MICPQCHYVFLDPKPTPPLIQLMYCPRCWTRIDTYFGPYLTRPHDWHDIRPWKHRLSQEALETYAEPLNWSCLPCHDFTDWWTGDSNGYEVAQAALEKCRQPSGGSF
jgi:hypothetical protein